MIIVVNTSQHTNVVCIASLGAESDMFAPFVAQVSKCVVNSFGSHCEPGFTDRWSLVGIADLNLLFQWGTGCLEALYFSTLNCIRRIKFIYNSN